MSLFKKIFGPKSKATSQDETAQERSKYMPELRLPVDEMFTINFKKNGGKFLYCDSTDEINEAFGNILKENDWLAKEAICLDEQLADRFSDFNIFFSKTNHNAKFFFSTCEYLVGNNGAILVSSRQIAEKKLNDLPDNFVVFATTSQLVETLGEGLRGIKNKDRSKIPSNITTIKHFEPAAEEKDFLSYGSSSKNLYLLLLEDL
ncbi:LUD domain-containing protein [Sungkyunkwania multivorans]|uniref:LUD domain-containing protein n=1 Tax=Sungkyunkwania multivorans TaxID=1173618 RepID=A0ABW3CYM2_9FLAO